MSAQLEQDFDEKEFDEKAGTRLSFVNPSHENQAINEPNRLGPNKGDGIFSAIGHRISFPGVAKLCQSATVTESKDKNKRVYRLHIEKRSENQILRYRLGLLEDGQAWAVMSKAHVMEIPTVSRCNSLPTGTKHADGGSWWSG